MRKNILPIAVVLAAFTVCGRAAAASGTGAGNCRGGSAGINEVRKPFKGEPVQPDAMSKNLLELFGQIRAKNPKAKIVSVGYGPPGRARRARRRETAPAVSKITPVGRQPRGVEPIPVTLRPDLKPDSILFSRPHTLAWRWRSDQSSLK